MVAASSEPKDLETLAMQAEMEAIDRAAGAEPAAGAGGKRKFVPAGESAEAPAVNKLRPSEEEIDIEDDLFLLETQPVPAAVFGASAAAAAATTSD